MSRDEAITLARAVKGRTRGRHDCAIFLNAFGIVTLVRGHGPQFESNLFRYPRGLIGRYDHHAIIAAIVEDLLAVAA